MTLACRTLASVKDLPSRRHFNALLYTLSATQSQTLISSRNIISVSPSQPTWDTTQLQNHILDGRTTKATSRRTRYGHGRRSWRSDCSSRQVSFLADYSMHHADITMHYSGETVHISALALLKVGIKSASARGVSLMVLSLTNRCSNMVGRAFQWRLWV